SNSHHKLPIRSGKKFDHFVDRANPEDNLVKEEVDRRHAQKESSQQKVNKEKPAAEAAGGFGGFFDSDVPGFEPADKGFPTAKREEEPLFQPHPLRPVPTSPLPRILE
ncbi:MAG: hypothetical protein ACK56I_33445, partial [bacterium]